jgi:perosamine synthetase
MSQRALAILGGTPVIGPSQHVRWPVLGTGDKAAVLQVLDRGVLSGPFAPEVTALEREFAAYVGSRFCVATNSGTAALHIALAAAGVGPGDEVIVPAFTFVASALSVLHQNAVPVFVDIEPITFGMDPLKVEAALTPRTRAIMPVHIHGTPCDLAPILALAERHGLRVIEDACQAHGARYRDRAVGSIGHLGTFSLQSSKTLPCGEGGLLVTDDEELLEKANRTRMFGENIRRADQAEYRIEFALDDERVYDSVTMGWMYRTNEMSAALARNQLKSLNHWIASARSNAERLSALLATLPGITPPAQLDGRVSNYHKYRVRLDASRLGITAPPRRVRDAMVRALKAEGADAVLWQTQPVPGQTLFREKIGFGDGCPWDRAQPVDYCIDQYPETIRLLESSLCLFSQTYPIAPQPPALCEAYAEAFANVWNRLDEVLARVPES